MAQPLVALGSTQKPIDTMGAFTQGAGNAAALNAQKIAQGKEMMNLIGRVSLGAQGGELDGQADPEKWRQGMEYLSRVSGQDMTHFADRPDLAQTFSRGSLDTMQQIAKANSDREFDLAMKKFQHTVSQAYQARQDRQAALSREAAQRQAQADWISQNAPEALGAFNAGIVGANDVYKALNNKGTPTDDMREYDKAVEQGYDGDFMQYLTDVKSAGATNVTTNVGDNLSPGWEAIDKGFSETYLNWIGGGSADTQAQIKSLENALDLLGKDGALTGTAVSALPRGLQAFVNTDGAIARENVEEVVQRSLRETLGAQFTEKEGERLIRRAFNPLLPEDENVRRVNLLSGKVAEMARAKDEMAAYFQKNGTLKGYQGKAPSMNNLLAVERSFGTDPQKGNDLPEGVSEEDIQFTMEKHGLTREQVLERYNNAR